MFVQVLRELFRQISTPSVEADGDTCHVIDDVTVIPGHVFVSTLPKQSSLTDELNDGTNELTLIIIIMYASSVLW